MAFYGGGFGSFGAGGPGAGGLLGAGGGNITYTPMGGGGAVARFRAGFGPGGLYGALGGGGWGGGGWGGGGTGGMPSSLAELLDWQKKEIEGQRALTEADWAQGKAGLLGVLPRYQADPMTVGARRNAQTLLDDPESLNDRLQAILEERSRNRINTGVNAQKQRLLGQLAAAGQMDPASMRSADVEAEQNRSAAIEQELASLGIARAERRNREIGAAAQLGAGLGQQQAGLDMGTWGTFLEQMPERVPGNLAGYVAALFGRGGLGGGMGAAFGRGTPDEYLTLGQGLSYEPGRPIPGQPGMGALGYGGMAGGAGPHYQGAGTYDYGTGWRGGQSPGWQDSLLAALGQMGWGGSGWGG